MCVGHGLPGAVGLFGQVLFCDCMCNAHFILWFGNMRFQCVIHCGFMFIGLILIISSVGTCSGLWLWPFPGGGVSINPLF